MARQGPLIGLGLGVAATLMLAHAARAADAPPAGSRPYAIRAHVSFDPSTRVDAAGRAIVVDAWLGLVRRFVGEPWRVDAVAERPELAATPLDALGVADLRPLADGVDKAWEIRVERPGGAFRLEGREFDAATGRVGEAHRVEAGGPSDLPRALLALARSLFEPVADVGAQRDGGVTFDVHGGAIDPASPAGAVAPVGTVFRALRLFLDEKDGSVRQVVEVPYTYFRVEERSGSSARCAIIAGVGDPLTGRYARRNRIVALGIRPATAPTRLRFLLKADRAPAAGYRLTARGTAPEATAYDVGITDREGRVELPPDFAPGLVKVRVLGGNGEPLADVPVMPGETRAERTVVFDGRPATLEFEAKLEALRDAIVDVVAERSRLEARMRARIDGADWPGFDAALAELRKLPDRAHFDGKLRTLRSDAERAEAAAKALILTRNARNQVDDTQALIDRYLEDEPIRALVDSAADAKANQAADAKAAAKPARP